MENHEDMYKMYGNISREHSVGICKQLSISKMNV